MIGKVIHICPRISVTTGGVYGVHTYYGDGDLNSLRALIEKRQDLGWRGLVAAIDAGNVWISL